MAGIWDGIINLIFGKENSASSPITILENRPNPGNLDWKHSIVDLLKFIGHDSSVNARMALAHEFGYTGTFGTPAMNEWLHAEVMKRLATHNTI